MLYLSTDLNLRLGMLSPSLIFIAGLTEPCRSDLTLTRELVCLELAGEARGGLTVAVWIRLLGRGRTRSASAWFCTMMDGDFETLSLFRWLSLSR